MSVKEPTREQLAIERADAIRTLRRLCSEHGDNFWSDDLHLSDIIDKHLFTNGAKPGPSDKQTT
jgi:hypothetical protein